MHGYFWRPGCIVGLHDWLPPAACVRWGHVGSTLVPSRRRDRRVKMCPTSRPHGGGFWVSQSWPCAMGRPSRRASNKGLRCTAPYPNLGLHRSSSEEALRPEEFWTSQKAGELVHWRNDIPQPRHRFPRASSHPAHYAHPSHLSPSRATLHVHLPLPKIILFSLASYPQFQRPVPSPLSLLDHAFTPSKRGGRISRTPRPSTHRNETCFY